MKRQQDKIPINLLSGSPLRPSGSYRRRRLASTSSVTSTGSTTNLINNRAHSVSPSRGSTGDMAVRPRRRLPNTPGQFHRLMQFQYSFMQTRNSKIQKQKSFDNIGFQRIKIQTKNKSFVGKKGRKYFIAFHFSLLKSQFQRC